MRLKELLKSLEYTSPDSALDGIEVKGLACDSKAVKKDFLFVAVSGTRLDGHDFVGEAITRGAVGVVAEREVPPADGVARIYVRDSRGALASVANEFYARPCEKIKCVGITGTNGKTSVSFLVEAILRAAGRRAAVIGTINYRIADRLIPATNTTPGVLELYGFMNEIVRNSIEYAVMEVSSHSLDQRRVEGINFSAAIFTNLSGDHLDYHKTAEEYFNAKAKLFEGLKGQASAVINTDDEWGRKLLSRSRAGIRTYGIKSEAQYSAGGMELSLGGTRFSAATPGGRIDIDTKLIGMHNVYNIIASMAAGDCLGVPLDAVKKGVESLTLVPGRLEPIDCGQPFKVFVDYAHTDDALFNVLSALKPLIERRIIVVFGCGGERDRTKRPRMGRVASRFADFIVVTADNPRAEEPLAIAREIEAGIERNDYAVILDREDAIKEALSRAEEGDCVLLAGKGHEPYQVFKDVTVPFDDREVARRILCSMRKKF